MRKLISSLLLFMLLFLLGCAVYVMPNNDSDKPVETGVIIGTGVIGHGGVEGPEYAIIGDDGRKFDPLNLPDNFKHYDLKVKFKLKPRSDRVSVHMWGEIVEVLKIEKSNGGGGK